jgi:hypothetical protein
MAFPAEAAMSDFMTEASGADCESSELGLVGLSLLQAIARISTPAKVMKLKERLDIKAPRLRIDGLTTWRGDHAAGRNQGRRGAKAQQYLQDIAL